MAKLYLINVGANTAHTSKARAPLFPGEQFMFIPFPDEDCTLPYNQAAWSFVSDPKCLRTHPDPDWQNLTYGDNCHNRRAKALLSVEPNDILLFWALFWKVARNAEIFRAERSERRWCIFGAIAVRHIVRAEPDREVPIGGTLVDKVTRDRAMKNVHVHNGALQRITPHRHDILFIGDPHRSRCFDRAVDLEVYSDGGLLRKIFFSKDQRLLRWDKAPRWSSSLRACRPVLDLARKEEFTRAEELRSAILTANPDFDLLASVQGSVS
jgi:hypothetical protein